MIDAIAWPFGLPAPIIGSFFAALLGFAVGGLVWQSALGFINGGTSISGILGDREDMPPDNSACVLRTVPLAASDALGSERICGDRQLAAQLVCAGAFFALSVRYGLSFETVEFSLLVCILLYLSIIDARRRIIPNACLVLAAIIRFVFHGARCAVGEIAPNDILYFALSAFAVVVLLVLIAFAMEMVTRRETMGGGDMKLYGVVGLYLGRRQAMVVIFASCVLAVMAIAVAQRFGCGAGFSADDGRALPRSSQGDGRRAFADVVACGIPFGPFISIACFLVILFGDGMGA